MLALSIMTTRTKREKGHIGDDKHLVHPLSEFHQLWDLFMTVRRRVAASLVSVSPTPSPAGGGGRLGLVVGSSRRLSLVVGSSSSHDGASQSLAVSGWSSTIRPLLMTARRRLSLSRRRVVVVSSAPRDGASSSRCVRGGCASDRVGPCVSFAPARSCIDRRGAIADRRRGQ